MSEDGYVKVYVFGGTVHHLLPAADSPNSYAAAVCRFSPNWPWMWMGTGSQDEYDEAASRPLCKYCAKRAVSTRDLLANLQASVDRARGKR